VERYGEGIRRTAERSDPQKSHSDSFIGTEELRGWCSWQEAKKIRDTNYITCFSDIWNTAKIERYRYPHRQRFALEQHGTNGISEVRRDTSRSEAKKTPFSLPSSQAET
jgi:hypothetical protein